MNIVSSIRSVMGGVHADPPAISGCGFNSRLDLMIIRSAWYSGISFEDLADGFGKGQGTKGDWSAIRESSEHAVQRMLDRALGRMMFKVGK